MRPTISSRLPAITCALSLLVCLALIRPWLDMGVHDEPSYVRTAQLLAQTGHVIYNGWAGPILGWQLYWGAAFIKLFGFSFNVVRLSTLPVAMLTAYLGQRTMLRAGVSQWNATLATLAFILSPLFIPLAFLFMTDVGGMLVVLLCLYGCLRAIESDSDARACSWLAFAALSNALGGSIRQTCWLGLVIMVPCALWLMHNRRRVLMWGSIALLCSLMIMVTILEWHKHQPFTITTALIATRFTGDSIHIGARILAEWVFDGGLFVLPVLVAFVPALRWQDRRSRLVLLIGMAMSIAAMAFFLTRPDPHEWLLPTGRDVVMACGMLNGAGIHGARPVLLHVRVRLLLTICVLLVLCGAAAAIAGNWRRTEPAERRRRSFDLLVLVVPFCAAYLAVVATQAPLGLTFDRYLLPILYVALLLLARFYQNRISARLPAYTSIVIAIFAAYGIAGTHDAFAMFRGWSEAAEEVRQSGVPRTAIDASWVYNSWTELENVGYLQWPSARYPAGVQVVAPQLPQITCQPQMWKFSPQLRPQYTLSFDPNLCSGLSSFPPVQYHEWMGPRTVTIYILRVEPGPRNAVKQLTSGD